MPSQGVEHLAIAVEAQTGLLERFLVGFDDTNATAQAPGLPNHVVWTLGHLALYHHRAADRIAGLPDTAPLPHADFVTADGAQGDTQRFDSESVCYASQVATDPRRFPTLDRATRIHRDAIARLASSVRDAGDDVFTRQTRWGSGAASISAATLASRMIFHTGTHTGQILDLRRALGLPRVIG